LGLKVSGYLMIMADSFDLNLIELSE